jgi:hypothetical protein
MRHGGGADSGALIKLRNFAMRAIGPQTALSGCTYSGGCKPEALITPVK